MSVHFLSSLPIHSLGGAEEPGIATFGIKQGAVDSPFLNGQVTSPGRLCTSLNFGLFCICNPPTALGELRSQRYRFHYKNGKLKRPGVPKTIGQQQRNSKGH